MQFIDNRDFKIDRGSVVTFGKFDGIHMGHRSLIERAKAIAKENNLYSIVLSFNLLPGLSFKNNDKGVITTSNERRKICETLGIDALIEYPFDENTASMEPLEFIEKIIRNQLNAQYVVVGSDWRFGRDRKGDADLLKASQKLYRFEAVILEKELYQNREISSTWVREEIAKGNMENVNILLGYPYMIRGTVEHGRELGRELGFPTVNVFPGSNKLLPPYGVYASKVYIDDRTYYGMTNVGIKPTVSDSDRVSAETYIIDFNDNVYDKDITIELLHFERNEMKFDSVEKLKNQLTVDIEFTKSYFLL